MSTETQVGHTPGPWRLKELREIVSEASNRHIAKVTFPAFGFVGYDEADANARLIAVAPEMLDALRELLSIVQSGDAPAYGNLPQVDLASRWYVTLASAVEGLAGAAIAKAEGR